VRIRAASALASLAILTTLTAQTPNERVKIVLVGDSTVAEGGGWGPGFRAAFGPDVDVVNLALNGRSSKSFRDEGSWTPAMTAKANYILIQFGHNDGPGKGPDRETDPTSTYRENMTRYVDDARASGAVPILVTSIVRRNQTADGKVKTDSLLPYVEEVRRLAAAKHILLMDMYALTLAQCERLGVDGCQALDAKTADGAPDTTHLGELGQREVGAIAAREFLRVVLPALPSADPKSVAATTLLPLNRARTSAPLPEPRDPKLPSLFIVGDSTVQNTKGDAASGLWGWGDVIDRAFDTSRLNVVNRAIPGMSSRTFRTLGHWDRVLARLKPGDIVLMQFGHNDASAINDATRARGSLPGIGTDETAIENLMTGEPEVVHAYGWYLRQFIAETQQKRASIVVCTPVPRRTWQNGHVARSTGYAPWATSVASSAHVPLIDLNSLVAARYDTLGPDAVARLFPSDNTHTNRAGAETIAAVVVDGLKSLRPNPLVQYLR
jgi:lysophospholipase L1-like esterase